MGLQCVMQEDVGRKGRAEPRATLPSTSQEVGSAEHLLQRAAAPCWWGAEPPNAFSQGELHEKGKGWIPPWTYFFPPSSLQCVDNLLLQPHPMSPSHLRAGA